MPLNDLEDEVLAHLQKLIMDGMWYITDHLSQRHITTGSPPQPPEVKVIIGDKVVSGNYPVVRIGIASPMKSEWLASGVRKDTYSCYIDCELKIAKKEIEDKATMALCNACRNWLLQRNHLSMEIWNSGATYYNAWCEDTTPGTKGDGSIRTMRFTWWCEVANSYFYAYGEV
jgi:hypothetical protein